MNACPNCGRRHPQTKVVAVDSWAWVRGDAHPANTEAWFKQQEESHRKRGKLYRRTFVKRVKAGRAVVEVTVAVLQTREPWVCEPKADL